MVVSWWGRGSTEDGRLPLVLGAARRHGLLVGLHLEPYEGRSPASLASDLTYAASLGVRDIYVYHPRDVAAADWATLRASAPTTLRLLAGTQLVWFAAAGGFAAGGTRTAGAGTVPDLCGTLVSAGAGAVGFTGTAAAVPGAAGLTGACAAVPGGTGFDGTPWGGGNFAVISSCDSVSSQALNAGTIAALAGADPPGRNSGASAAAAPAGVW